MTECLQVILNPGFDNLFADFIKAVSLIKHALMKKDTPEYNMILERQRLKIADAKLLMGSTTNKYPVVLDGGKTTIYISDKSKEEETRIRYASRMEYLLMRYPKKTKS